MTQENCFVGSTKRCRLHILNTVSGEKIRQMREHSSTFFPLERTLIICCIRRKRQKSRGMSMKRCSVYVEHFLSVSGLRESVPIICIPGMKTIIFAENAEQNS